MRGAALVLALMTVAAAGVSLLVSHRRGREAAGLEVELAQAIERGSLADLGRAQALGRRLLIAAPDDGEAAAALAFANAVLASDYGLYTDSEAEAALERVAGRQLTEAGAATAGAARALIALRRGDRETSAREASRAAAEGGTPYPLYALGRARAAGGDMLGASRALEAAMVVEPAFVPATLGWAEVRIDAGDAKGARAALQALVDRVPGETRARLLLDEVGGVEGAGPSEALERACRAERPGGAIETAGCALAEGTRARLQGARAVALARAEAAAGVVPDEPRLEARVAVLLAQLGAVDRASALVDRAARRMAPQAPARAWADLAVSLGRGHAAPTPSGVRPGGAEARLLAARAALAVGGVGALGAALDRMGRAAVAHDTDLRELARLTGGARAADGGPPAGAAAHPIRAYVDGLRARLDGDLPRAADRFTHALSGHGDACRAAGEYVATLRALKRRPDPTTLAPLRAENSACINLLSLAHH
jgi:hypothetical protein